MLKHFIATLLVAGLVGCGAGHTINNRALTEAGVAQELAQFRKEHYGQVRYSLFFSIPENKQEPVKGKAIISIQTEERLPLIIDFRGKPEQVSSVSLNGTDIAYEVKDEHILLSPEITAAGKNEIAISFIADDQSLNRRDEFLYTLLVPDRARTLFPCFDQPDMKAVFTLALEVPDTWEAVANGAVAVVMAKDDGRKLIAFNETEPVSTYLFSFVAGKLTKESYDRGGRAISVYHRETDPKKIAQCPDIAGEVFDALEWLEGYTGIPYPFAKYDLIILPGFQYGGMEHTGATLYTDRRMFLDEHPTLNERLTRSALIAHETSHMWFGDYVTMRWFNDVWTKEVFANYFASRIVEPLFPDVNHRLNFMNDYLLASYAEDRTAGANPIQQKLDNLNNAGLVYGNIIYDKSPVMMEMLVRKMGEESFRKGIREYLKTYAYGNATWDNLIAILDGYTDEDLEAWSRIWVKEKGMPEITAQIVGDSLEVSQSDPLGRNLTWPQELTYRIICGDHSETVFVSFERNSCFFRKKLNFHPKGTCTIVPNTDGRGYGFFRVAGDEAGPLFALLKTSGDEVLRGSLLITLYENLLNLSISPETYMNAMLDYLPEEQNRLLFSLSLGYIGYCYRWYSVETALLEQTLWKIVTTSPVAQYRLQAFRLYASVAESEDAANRLYALWKDKRPLPDCALSETDYINLSYGLAIRFPERAGQIVKEQLSRIANPDKQKEYLFISPSVSPEKAVRDSVFNSLMIAGNRRVEPWASSTLANLNNRFRQKEALSYIRPALEVVQEVQRTGDIFFPSAWCRALLAGHTSEAARREVDAFFEAHPDYPVMLSNKIKQQSDHLYRLHPVLPE